MDAFVIVFHSPEMESQNTIIGVVLADSLKKAEGRILEIVKKHNVPNLPLGEIAKGEMPSRGGQPVDDVVAHIEVNGGDEAEYYLVCKTDEVSYGEPS